MTCWMIQARLGREKRLTMFQGMDMAGNFARRTVRRLGDHSDGVGICFSSAYGNWNSSAGTAAGRNGAARRRHDRLSDNCASSQRCMGDGVFVV